MYRFTEHYVGTINVYQFGFLPKNKCQCLGFYINSFTKLDFISIKKRGVPTKKLF